MKTFIGFVRRLCKTYGDNDCALRAAGLTYYALLAVIPVLCCILSLAKACGVDRFAREKIDGRIEQLVADVESPSVHLPFLADADPDVRERKRLAARDFALQARSAANALFARIEKFSVRSLGVVGLVLLLWTIVSSFGMVETSFNRIWGVARPRPLWRRLYLYLFLLVILPVLTALVLSLPILNAVKDIILSTLGATWLTQRASAGLVALIDSTLFRSTVSLTLASAALGLVYWVLPYRRVNLRAALVGGVFCALLGFGWLKVCTLAQVGIAKSSALYGSFALVPIVLAWLDVSEQILLLGACLARQLDESRTSGICVAEGREDSLGCDGLLLRAQNEKS